MLTVSLSDVQETAVVAAVERENAVIAADNNVLEAAAARWEKDSQEVGDGPSVRAANIRAQKRAPVTVDMAIAERVDRAFTADVAALAAVAAAAEQKQIDAVVERLKAMPPAERDAAKARIRALVGLETT